MENLVENAERKHLDFTFALTVDISPEGIRYVRGNQIYGLEKRELFVPTSSWLHRRDITKKIGAWSEDYWKLAEPPDKDFFTKAYISTSSELTPKLTVIKFSSDVWRSYKRNDEVLQSLASYWEAISQGSERLESDLLNDISLEFSRYVPGLVILTPAESFRMLLRYYYKVVKRNLMLAVHRRQADREQLRFVFLDDVNCSPRQDSIRRDL